MLGRAMESPRDRLRSRAAVRRASLQCINDGGRGPGVYAASRWGQSWRVRR